MGEISGEEAAMLAALIYRPRLQKDWNNIGNKNLALKDLIDFIEKDMERKE